MRRQGLRLLFAGQWLALALVVANLPSNGQQVSATLVGTLRDAGGGVIPQAALTATNANTGVVTRTTSDSAGNYVFTTLAPGVYTITGQRIRVQ
jgi:protocatechuate 3,4-dioxygenase beta subunit